ncbi:hypothetical protein ABZ499_27705 [Streptomyces sp. NPDC019990]|uniref:hypothetical protein n=1 Tax=Streptomyces sp. NPDC019990 TaxID=3154693 RepID=UPI0033C8C277
MPEPSVHLYSVTLHKDGEQVGATFPWRELPTPGLLFEHGDFKYRLKEVSVFVPSQGAEPEIVDCEVVEAYKWVKNQDRWVAVFD